MRGMKGQLVMKTGTDEDTMKHVKEHMIATGGKEARGSPQLCFEHNVQSQVRRKS
jgi:hypothetical protein